MVIQKSNPYFSYETSLIFENGTEYSYWGDEPRQSKASVDFNEQMIGQNEIQVTINLLIEDVQSGDDTFIITEISKMPVLYLMNTQLIVAPNTEPYPAGYLGVKMYSHTNYDDMYDPDSTIGLLIGQNSIIECIGIGNKLSDIYLTKDGRRLESSGYDLVFHNLKSENWMNVLYSIANTSESDAGQYSCVVEGASGNAKTDRTVIVSEEVISTISVEWWNATQVG